MIRAQLGAIISATSLIQLANGFFTTVVSLSLGSADLAPLLDGMIVSSYFLGFTVGAATAGRLLSRTGHVRAYAAFAGIVIASTSGMAMQFDATTWAILRTFIGYGCAGLFVTAESWLHTRAPAKARGRVFAIYMTGTFLALALGQLLTGSVNLNGPAPFSIITGLFALAVIVVSTTRADQPTITAAETVHYREILGNAPLAVVGCVLSGMIGATFYAVFPAWMLVTGFSQVTISMFMLSAVLGGLSFQYPVGRLSDRFDRRSVLSGIGIGLGLMALAITLAPRTYLSVLPIAFVLGGAMSTIYPVAVSHALDQLAPDKIASVSSRMILLSGLGSITGPMVAFWVMERLDIDGVAYMISILASVLAVSGLLMIRFGASPHAKSEHHVGVVAPQAIRIDES